jgi:uncharacterized protein
MSIISPPAYSLAKGGRKRLLISSLVLCFSVVQLNAQTKLMKYVTDETNTLTPSQISSLESKLSSFEKETSNQVVVYMIETLGGESLEETSHEIAEKNRIGQKGKDNGVLLFIVMKDRKLRIEVGYGLEGSLPDALADQIIRKEITPYFKQEKYYEGINAGVDAIIKATRGEYKQDTKKSSKDDDNGTGFWICGLPLLAVIFFGFFGAFIVISIIRSILGLGRRGRSGWWYTGGSGWTTSGSSWSSGSSSGSFGGFSGGGGSFGGGGASGSW